MNIFSLLGRTKAPPCPARRPPPHEAPSDDKDGRPLGCGWFDSSHELESGLVVREHDSADTLARELPLALWLDIERQCRPN